MHVTISATFYSHLHFRGRSEAFSQIIATAKMCTKYLIASANRGKPRKVSAVHVPYVVERKRKEKSTRGGGKCRRYCELSGRPKGHRNKSVSDRRCDGGRAGFPALVQDSSRRRVRGITGVFITITALILLQSRHAIAKVEPIVKKKRHWYSTGFCYLILVHISKRMNGEISHFVREEEEGRQRKGLTLWVRGKE